MAEWFFRKKSKVEVERDPGWDEYFTSNRSTEESLVREAIQNSLDAHSKCESLESQSGPARVRIYYSGKTKPLLKDAYAKYLADAAAKSYFINLEGQKMSLPAKFLPSKTLLEKHRDLLAG